jgi:hypothetical protein
MPHPGRHGGWRLLAWLDCRWANGLETGRKPCSDLAPGRRRCHNLRHLPPWRRRRNFHSWPHGKMWWRYSVLRRSSSCACFGPLGMRFGRGHAGGGAACLKVVSSSRVGMVRAVWPRASRRRACVFRVVVSLMPGPISHCFLLPSWVRLALAVGRCRCFDECALLAPLLHRRSP